MTIDEPLTADVASVMELVEAIQRLAMARNLPTVQEIVRSAARRISGADGATFVLRDGDRCHYADEDAIEPLWKGQRFPMSACISGWSMLNRQAAIIEDIYADHRIPHDAYRPTFVKSLVMMPIRTLDPVGAIGTYWAAHHSPSDSEVKLLRALADSTAVAMENVRVFGELEERVKARTLDLEKANQELSVRNRELLAAHEQADRVFAAYARVLPGTVLDGKYRLDQELGSGGFGVVYRGRHLSLDCPIAIKVFRPRAGNDSAHGLQRFLREGATAARVDHPNAVRVLDSGVSKKGIAFLIMELLDGRSLSRELATTGPLALRRAVLIAARVAEVLALAHRHCILHRDIKPDNVFLHKAGGAEIVKVVDFGIAKYFGNATAGTDRKTVTVGYILGTPSFVAPERISGKPDDGRSDVFSLGATLFEMICGTIPWTKPQQIQLASGTAENLQPRAIAGFRAGVPQELEVLVQRSLECDPRMRPTAAEFSAALIKLATSLDDSPPQLLRKPSEPEPTMDLAVTVWPDEKT